jgi:hypothetical protein
MFFRTVSERTMAVCLSNVRISTAFRVPPLFLPKGARHPLNRVTTFDQWQRTLSETMLYPYSLLQFPLDVANCYHLGNIIYMFGCRILKLLSCIDLLLHNVLIEKKMFCIYSIHMQERKDTVQWIKQYWLTLFDYFCAYYASTCTCILVERFYLPKQRWLF